jgi:hypothetical protein
MTRHGLSVVARVALIIGLLAAVEAVGHSCATGYGILVPLFAPTAVALSFYWDVADRGWPRLQSALISCGVCLTAFVSLAVFASGGQAGTCG